MVDQNLADKKKIMEKKIGLKAMIEQQNKKKWGFEQTVDQELIEECKKKDGD